MKLCVNQLFQWNNEGARIERILWIEDAGQRLVTIDVTDKQAWPSFIERSFLERHITDGSIHLLDSDMYEYLRQPDNALTLSDIEQRERAWRVIADIVASQQEETGIPGNGAIFQSPTLDLLVQAAVERTGCSKQWICTCLRRYWQRGQLILMMFLGRSVRIWTTKLLKEADLAISQDLQELLQVSTLMIRSRNTSGVAPSCFTRISKGYL